MICNNCPYYDLLTTLLNFKQFKNPYAEQSKIEELIKLVEISKEQIENERKRLLEKATNYSQSPYDIDDTAWLTEPKEKKNYE